MKFFRGIKSYTKTNHIRNEDIRELYNPINSGHTNMGVQTYKIYQWTNPGMWNGWRTSEIRTGSCDIKMMVKSNKTVKK